MVLFLMTDQSIYFQISPGRTSPSPLDEESRLRTRIDNEKLSARQFARLPDPKRYMSRQGFRWIGADPSGCHLMRSKPNNQDLPSAFRNKAVVY